MNAKNNYKVFCCLGGVLLWSQVANCFAAVNDNNFVGHVNNTAAVTCDTKCQADLQKMLDDFRVNKPAPGNPVISGMQMSISLSNDQPIINFVSGTLTKDGDTYVKPASVFEIGSITKSFTSAIILQLEAEGKLSINDTLGQWLPEFFAWSDVTIKELLNMKGGLFDYANDDPEFGEQVYQDQTKFWPMYNLAQISYQHDPNTWFKAGSDYHYSNVQYTLAGMIIEKVTHKTIAQNMQERIFKPLGLSATIYNDNLVPSSLANIVHGYYYDTPGPLQYGDDTTNINTSVYNAAGTIIANTEDVTKWVRALFFGQVVSELQFTEMTSLICMRDDRNTCKPGEPLPPDSDQLGYGLGLGHLVIEPFGSVWEYGGSTVGYKVEYYYIPDENFIVTIAGDISPCSYYQLAAAVYSYFYPIPPSVARFAHSSDGSNTFRLFGADFL